MFSIATKQASSVSNSLATLNGEVTSLDKSVIDAVCAFFEYGQNSDLSDATAISGEYNVYVFQDGGGVAFEHQISNLSEETTYYYRAKGRAVRYDSMPTMQYATDKTGFLQDLANNSTEHSNACNNVDDYIDDSTILANLLSSAIGREVLLMCSEIRNTLWEKATPSQDFWHQGSPTPDGSFNFGETPYWQIDIDVTHASTLRIYYYCNFYGDSEDYLEIQIGGNKFVSVNSVDGATEATVDVSGMTGIKTLTCTYSYYGSTTLYADLSSSITGRGGYSLFFYDTDAGGDPEKRAEFADIKLE